MISVLCARILHNWSPRLQGGWWWISLCFASLGTIMSNRNKSTRIASKWQVQPWSIFVSTLENLYDGWVASTQVIIVTSILNLGTCLEFDVKVIFHLWVSRDGSVVFSHLASWAFFHQSGKAVGVNLWFRRHLVSRFWFPINDRMS